MLDALTGFAAGATAFAIEQNTEIGKFYQELLKDSRPFLQRTIPTISQLIVDVYNYVRYFADFNTFQGNRSVRALREAWQPSNPSAPRSQWTAANPDATSPIMDANDQISSRTSSYLIEDASYFRLRNVQLTYTFGDSLNETLGISGGNIYFQGQNLLTVTDYSGLNPEIQTGNDIQLGYDGGFMPVSRTLIVGLNLSLF